MGLVGSVMVVSSSRLVRAGKFYRQGQVVLGGGSAWLRVGHPVGVKVKGAT